MTGGRATGIIIVLCNIGYNNNLIVGLIAGNLLPMSFNGFAKREEQMRQHVHAL